jgi:5-guanidino-2-oxopentanoate decarboxylase
LRALSLAAVEEAIGDALRREGPTLIEMRERDFGEL